MFLYYLDLLNENTLTLCSIDYHKISVIQSQQVRSDIYIFTIRLFKHFFSHFCSLLVNGALHANIRGCLV